MITSKIFSSSITMPAKIISCNCKLTLFIPCIGTKFLIYKINTCTSNIHNNTVSCLHLHVSVELCLFRQFIHHYFKTHYNVIHYNCNMYYVVVLPTAELKSVRSHKILLKIIYNSTLL